MATSFPGASLIRPGNKVDTMAFHYDILYSGGSMAFSHEVYTLDDLLMAVSLFM